MIERYIFSRCTMSWRRVLGFFFVFTTSIGICLKEEYAGHKVIQTEVLKSAKTIEDLVHFVQSSPAGAFDFWVHPGIGGVAKIMASPPFLSRLEMFLNAKSVPFRIIIDDVQRAFQTEAKFLKRRIFKKPSADKIIDWESYYSTKDIYKYMHQLEKEYDFVSVVNYGKSFENKNLKVLRIRSAGVNASNIFVEAGMHAREWISPSMATYLIHRLLKDDSSSFLKRFNFHIIPLVNPDGYEYSRRSDRLWRKTRALIHGSSCRGVDGNRNWNIHWGEKGVNFDPCSQNYPGPFPFSEPETNSIRKYLERLVSPPVLSLSLHSAANLLLVPYGYSNSAYPQNYIELLDLAEEAVQALNQVYHSDFKAIHSANLYPASGSSDDWYVGVLGSRFAYTFELRQGGHYGFDLPPEQITPSGVELWAAFQTFLDKIVYLKSKISKEEVLNVY